MVKARIESLPSSRLTPTTTEVIPFPVASFVDDRSRFHPAHLERRVQQAQDPIESTRFLAVYPAKRGLAAKAIAKIAPNT